MKATKYRKQQDNKCVLISHIKIGFNVTTTIIIQEIASQKFYWEKKKITRKLIEENIRKNLLCSGLNHYDYHSDNEMDEYGDNKPEKEEQYIIAAKIAKRLFPDFFEITDHMKNKGCIIINDEC